jgi:hypothetical protein
MGSPLPGYPDYARVSLTSGYLLAGGNNDISAGTIVFQGYVGNWSYINEYFQNTVAGNYYTININYYTDSTFTVPIAQQVSVRGNQTLAYRQHGVLSPWVAINVTPNGAHSLDTVYRSFYGSNQRATSGQLGSLDVSGIHDDVILSPGGEITAYDAHVMAGPATVSIQVLNAQGYFVNLECYNTGSASYRPFWSVNDLVAVRGGTWNVSLPDCPYQARLHNNGTGNLRLILDVMATST